MTDKLQPEFEMNSDIARALYRDLEAPRDDIRVYVPAQPDVVIYAVNTPSIGKGAVRSMLERNHPKREDA